MDGIKEDHGYCADPPSAMVWKYKCDQCGARYESGLKVDRFGKCRNRHCLGIPRRGGW